ncbi:hypothetical protein UY3_01537 [Chelonia mydas]|uniref:Uncharacterized protein n=1 Tax=Chelonia mydas TaxID=8469 RepID=M7C9A0_CHEMY|nr:hypothetical protein UY3_01537 [Chelonia mydas]
MAPPRRRAPTPHPTGSPDRPNLRTRQCRDQSPLLEGTENSWSSDPFMSPVPTPSFSVGAPPLEVEEDDNLLSASSISAQGSPIHPYINSLS